MGKIIITADGKKLKRLSRWIQIQHNYTPGPRNRLAYYITDENGYHENQAGFNPNSEKYLDYFRWNGRTWAIEQFYILGGLWTGGQPYFYTDDDGKTGVIGAYDSENYYNPILLELDDYAEHVRIYREV